MAESLIALDPEELWWKVGRSSSGGTPEEGVNWSEAKEEREVDV